INPHFLFNSLNTLLDLVEEDKEKAIQYIRSFSRIYRSVLQSAKYDFIALEDELKFLSEYWSLLKVRFHDAIDLSIDINANKMSSLIPPLSLQFLVENAVKHNEASSTNPLRIEIGESKNRLIVRNKINLKSSVESEKLGLQNLQQRFSLLHKPLEYKNENGHFIVSIPLKTVA
ncbi:MAG: histidine kinase, partial [Ekhidna sp.]